jgi:hypothetical protein
MPKASATVLPSAEIIGAKIREVAARRIAARVDLHVGRIEQQAELPARELDGSCDFDGNDKRGGTIAAMRAAGIPE